MKIAILGFSGSGKSTLAQQLGAEHQLPVVHLDSLHFLPGWVERDPQEERALLGEFMDTHQDWVIEGSYSYLHFERRMDEADQIYILMTNRWIRLFRVLRRTAQHLGTPRPEMTDGCPEKFTFEFIRWVLWDGCRPARRQQYLDIARHYPHKTTIRKN